MVINLINFKSVYGTKELLGMKNQSCPFLSTLYIWLKEGVVDICLG